ncbi:MAG: sugar transferase [Roseiflexaceae bacterium]
MSDLTEAFLAKSRAQGAAPLATRSRRPSRRAALVAVDAALILIGFAIAYWMRYIVDWPPPFEQIVSEVATQNFVPLAAFMPISLLLLAVLLAQFTMKGLYRLPRPAGLLDHAGIILSSTVTGTAIVVLVAFINRPFFYSRLIFAFACVIIIVLLCAWRGLLISFRRWRWARGIGRERVLVVGGTGLGRHVMEGIVAQPSLGYALVGYLEDRDPPPGTRPNGHFRHLGPIEQLASFVRQGTVDQVIIALPFWQHRQLPELVEICRVAGVDFRVAPDLYELSFDRVNVDNLSGIPLIGLKELSLKGWNLVLKRVMDLALVLLAAPLLLPLAALIAWAIKRDSPGPAIFKQQRVGKSGRLFMTYKFRTMVVDAEERKADLAALNEADGPIFKIRNDPRMTRLGRILRRTSMDELPQLWNVVRGEMSLVGPRPPTPEEAARYEEWHKRRLEVKPGLTGLWQVLGRSDTSFDEMVRLDIYYAESWSPGMDLRILLQTIPVVISGKGAY